MPCFSPHFRTRRYLPVPLALTIGGCLAGSAAAAPPQVQSLPVAPAAGPSVIAPGVTYQRLAESDGRVMHVVRTRPQTARLTPFLTSGSVSSTGNLQAAVAARDITTVAAVNGDFFNVSASYPSGMTVIDNRLVSAPEPSRSALVMGGDGTLSAGRFTLTGAWQTTTTDGLPIGQTRKLTGLNRPSVRSNEMLLYTSDYTRPTPTGRSRNEAVVRLDPGVTALAPAGVIAGTVVAQNASGGAVVTPGTVVITGLGSQRATVVSDLALGQRVRVTTAIGGFPQGAQAVGGGPLLVDAAAPVSSAGEGFSSSQVDQRTSRTAVGQLTDGGYLLVTVEGPGQSRAGVTNAELAQTAAKLGARLAVAMDAGGSAQMVVDGWPVLAWSSPRSITTAVGVDYDGVRIGTVPRRLTPNRDRVDDTTTATIVAPKAGVLSVALVRRGGSATPLLRQPVPAGKFPLPINPRNSRISDGPYRLAAQLTPNDGTAPSTASRDMVLDSTLGSLTTRPFRLKAGRRTPRPSVAIGFTLARRAVVTVRIENAQGKPVRWLISRKRMRTGTTRLVWDRYVRKSVAQGTVRIVVIARSGYGASGLVSTLTLPKVMTPKPRTAPKRP